MLKKSITYTNPFTDKEVTEEHYFHISKADMVEMEMEEHNLVYKAKDGQDYTGMQAKLMQIIDSEDGKAILAEMKDIIRRSYGRKEGDRFLKSNEIWQDFAASEAFSQLLFELCTDAEKAGEFMNGVIPNNLAAEAQRIAAQSADRENGQVASVTPLRDMSQGGSTTPADPEPTPPGEIEATLEREPRLLTQAEIVEMDAAELQSGIAAGRYKLS